MRFLDEFDKGSLEKEVNVALTLEDLMIIATALDNTDEDLIVEKAIKSFGAVIDAYSVFDLHEDSLAVLEGEGWEEELHPKDDAFGGDVGLETWGDDEVLEELEEKIPDGKGFEYLDEQENYKDEDPEFPELDNKGKTPLDEKIDVRVTPKELMVMYADIVESESETEIAYVKDYFGVDLKEDVGGDLLDDIRDLLEEEGYYAY